MDVLPLPPRPDLAQYRKRAKALVAAARSADPDAVRAWAADWLGALARLSGKPVTPFVQGSIDRAVADIETRVRETRVRGARDVKLADAQFLVARAHGFESWGAFANHVDHLAAVVAGGAPFEAAVDAVVGGDVDALRALLDRDPELIRARSPRVHRATLLHYVAANGVEDFRQKTPPNAVDVARFLLGSGAEVDALAGTYGGGSYQTTLNLLVSSTHPADAGLQAPLVELLLDHGAAIDGLDGDGSPLLTALAFGHGDAADALARRGARVDHVITAAAVGRVDLVDRFVVDAETLRHPLPVAAPRWMRLATHARGHIELGFLWACAFGHGAVVELLAGRGVNLAAGDPQRMTGLHWAAGNGHLDVVRFLIARGAPLEARNEWGGTVLDATAYFARQHPADADHYAAVVEVLVSAGADVGAVTPFPTGIARVDEILRRHGAH